MTKKIDWLFSFDEFEEIYGMTYLESFKDSVHSLPDFMKYFEPYAPMARSYYFTVQSLPFNGRVIRGCGTASSAYTGPQFLAKIERLADKKAYLGWRVGALWRAGGFIWLFEGATQKETITVTDLGIAGQTTTVYIELVTTPVGDQHKVECFVNGDLMKSFTTTTAGAVTLRFGPDSTGNTYSVGKNMVISDFYHATDLADAPSTPYSSLIVEAEKCTEISNEKEMVLVTSTETSVIAEVNKVVGSRISDKTSAAALPANYKPTIFTFESGTKVPIATSIRSAFRRGNLAVKQLKVSPVKNGVAGTPTTITPVDYTAKTPTIVTFVEDNFADSVEANSVKLQVEVV